MTIKVAINGFGRIGRMVLRAHYEGGKKHGLQFLAINDLGDARTNAHLLKYDTAHGRFPGSVRVDGESMVVDDERIRVAAERMRSSSTTMLSPSTRTLPGNLPCAVSYFSRWALVRASPRSLIARNCRPCFLPPS